jgi:tetratricopeptide (TPR) repeat protein
VLEASETLFNEIKEIKSSGACGLTHDSSLAEPVLVGRDNELAQLDHLMKLAMAGEGSLVVISGEAGSGKTRLTNEFLEHAKIKGLLVLSGWCLENAAIPYFPFAEAFEHAIEINNISASQKIALKTKLIESTSAELYKKNEFTNPQIWKDHAFSEVTTELLSISTSKPTILFIDDIHWADSASISLLHYIARAASSERLLMIATFRNEELTNTADGLSHPLAKALHLMGREGLVKKINLSNLKEAEVGKIAESMLKGKLNADFASKLFKESQGNPLFIVESLQMMHSQRNLVLKQGLWQLANDKMIIPEKVKDVILHRLTSLKNSHRRILDAASVVGQKFDPKLVAMILSQTNIDVLEALNNLAKSTLMVLNEKNHYAFKHAKIQEMIYNEIPPPLKREYHSRIAESLESTNLNIDTLPLNDIAYHYIQAENNQKALKYSLAAGQDALKKWSNIEAIKHFKLVLQIILESPETNDKKILALEGLGDAYFANDNFKEAAETFERLANIQNGAPKLRAFRKAMFSAWYKGDLVLLKKFTQLAEENATADRLESARVLHQKARLFGIQGQMNTCIEMLNQSLTIFEEEYALEDAAWLLFTVGHGATMQGYLEKGISESLRAIALYDEIGDIRSQMEAYLYTGLSFQDCSLYNEAINMINKVIQSSDRLKMWDNVRLILAYESLSLSLQETDVPGAITKALKALELSEKTDSKLYAGFIHGTLVCQYTTIGNLTQAEEHYNKLVELPKEILANIFSLVVLNLASAMYYAGKNDFEKSERFIEEYFKFTITNNRNPGTEERARKVHALVLSKQGKMKEAQSEIEQAQTLVENAQRKFEHVNINAGLMTTTKPTVNQTFEIRLDLVNPSRSSGKYTKIENLLVPDFELVTYNSEYTMTKGVLHFKEPSINPFQVKTIKLTVRIPKPCTFTLNPMITYIDDLGKIRSSKPRPIIITAQPVSLQDIKTKTDPRLAFTSEPSQTVFNYLQKAFNDDCFLRMLPKEKSGWRSLMQTIKEAHVTKHSLYGQTGRGGETISELKRLKLIETKFFASERGRGGTILKIRTLAKEPADNEIT